MEFDWIWKAILIIVIGTLLLRVAGRKSISQMSLAQTVLMIGIGSLLIQPVSGKNIWVTFGVCAILILTLIALEYFQLKSDKVENFITGKSAILIENGQLVEKNLKKYRLTVDLLEMLLRQQNVTKISDVEWATIEPNGQIGYLLKSDAQPMTKGDFQQVNTQLKQLQTALNVLQKNTDNNTQNPKEQDNIFQEVADKQHQTPPPKHLE
ncbi:Uncharacterized membrane protein YcaP, DUF421 family [Gracilibacillus orientalis]|uniref:Uncharacterized membrane protein YcaP, DUF421 family n=1 Tax=Gracilibacillus orientalis TaxID=334253 RepID=A0A1I4MEZ7_9BACI|nr:DUF421 domain-containing protein [Gracilibacillus orientalis]SFM01854.1 Uncharacterized membrane protein YcaP, DUF421 family [Gracilibacillus orientalis]